MNFADQIRGLLEQRQTLKDEMLTLVALADEEERDLDDDEKGTFDELIEKMEALDKRRERLERAEKLMGEKALPVPSEEDLDALERQGKVAHIGGHRANPDVTVERIKAYPADTFTRSAIALAVAKGNPMVAEQIAGRRWKDHPEVLSVIRAAVEPIDTTDSGGTSTLVQTLEAAGEFIDLLRPETIVGRLPGLRRLQFDNYGSLKIGRQTGGVTGGYVGEDNSIRVQRLNFGDITLTPSKLAVIVIASNEALRRVNPSLEQLIRDDMVQGTAQTIDTTFMSAAAAGDNPAGILNGKTANAGAAIAAAANVTAVTNALSAMLMAMRTANLRMQAPAWVMNPRTETYLRLQRTTQETFAWRDEMNAGALLGYPFISSTNVNADVSGGATNDAYLMLVDANEILFAEDMAPIVDASEHAAIQADDAPATPPDLSTGHVSLFQQDKTAFRIRMSHTWARRRDEAVDYGLALI